VTPGGLSEAWIKRDPNAPPGFFAAEAAGLGWMAETGCVRVPAVLEVGDHHIALERVPTGAPSVSGAEALGRSLAELHQTGAAGFGAPWPGYIGPLPMDNGGGPDWATFYAERRVQPFLRAAREAGTLDADHAADVERALSLLASGAPDLPGAGEPPSRIHGDLWSGNVVWDTGGEPWLVDPAAHGGHRETDLAMLALFGLPHLERVLGSYDERRPLAEGWRDRVGLHQLHPLLVHAVLFGGGYGARAGAAARGFLRIWG
jgi:fructosamine-3-kinase